MVIPAKRGATRVAFSYPEGIKDFFYIVVSWGEFEKNKI
jgi:hypothetical protein